MSDTFKNVVGLVWGEIIALGLAYLHYVSYRNPTKNKLTKTVNRYWTFWTSEKSWVGFASIFDSAQSAMLFQAWFLLILGIFMAVMFVVTEF